MNTEQAIKRIEGLLDAFDENEHNEYFEESGEEVCEAAIMMYSALRAQYETICPLLSDDEVKQPCIKGPCPAYLNEPLTLEELKERIGKPVYMVIEQDAEKGLGESKAWKIIRRAGGNTVYFNGGCWPYEYAKFYDHESKAVDK